MAVTDRVTELVEGVKRRHRPLVSPEGVPLDIRIATVGERVTALLLDLVFMLLAVIVLFVTGLMLFFSGKGTAAGLTLFLFIGFLIRNLYFIHFELAWQGRTPGKRICNLRVINREGGNLSPGAVVARNLTREVEIFTPLALFFTLEAAGGWTPFVLFCWMLCLTLVPLFNRDRLRAGDLIAGTQVISMPKRVLLKDLSTSIPTLKEAGYSFSHEQLAVYGAFELQVLEEFLRRPFSRENQQQLEAVYEKIVRKIGWDEPVSPPNIRRFLTDFYTAERADLERRQLFGQHREDKHAAKTAK